MKKLSFEDFKQLLLYKRVTEWNKEENYIVLEDGIKLTIEMTDWDCCASASGEFEDVVLDAAITDVTEPKYKAWKDDDTYGCAAVVKMLHNQNLICKAIGDADAGNGGYYYSIASFIVTMPKETGKQYQIHFVGSGDE